MKYDYSELYIRIRDNVYNIGQQVKVENPELGANIQASDEDYPMFRDFMKEAFNNVIGHLVKHTSLSVPSNSENETEITVAPLRKMDDKSRDQITGLIYSSISDYVCAYCVNRWLLLKYPKMAMPASMENIYKYVSMIDSKVRRRPTCLAGI